MGECHFNIQYEKFKHTGRDIGFERAEDIYFEHTGYGVKCSLNMVKHTGYDNYIEHRR